LAFVALFVAGAAVYCAGAGSGDAEIAAYYASHSNRVQQLVGFALIVAAAVFFAVFASGLVPRLAVVTGAVSAGLLLLANALWAASAMTIELEPDYRLDPRTHLMFEDASSACFAGAAAAAIPLVVAVSLRTPSRWFALCGVPVVGALAASNFYFPFFAFLAWVVITALGGTRLVAGDSES
jgi:hypothetical protein